MSKNDTTLTVRLPQEVVEELRAYSEILDRSMGYIVRMALAEWINAQGMTTVEPVEP